VPENVDVAKCNQLSPSCMKSGRQLLKWLSYYLLVGHPSFYLFCEGQKQGWI